MLIVFRRFGSTPAGQAKWECQCDCGKTTIVRGQDLRNGHTTSCGCYGQAIRSAAGVKARNGHGLSRTPIYWVWRSMIQRCYNHKSTHFKDYGGRGIEVCSRWRKFDNFLIDMGPIPEGLTLDRHPDNNGNYEPGNCRWATWEEQQNNRRNTVIIEYDNRRLSLSQWARVTGISRHSIRWRIRSGWPLHLALTLPTDMNRRLSL